MPRGEVRSLGPVVYEVVGEGLPVTVYVHGMAGTADDCRPWASTAGGTGLLVELRGHGRSGPVPSEGWTYADFADDVRAVADAESATAAVAVSAGSGALLHLIAATPARFDRIVLALPAALDSPRTDASVQRLMRLGEFAQLGDIDAIVAALIGELPAEVADSRLARIWARRRASRLVADVPPYQREGAPPPVPDVSALRAVEAPTLVLGEADDPLHQLSLAEQVAASLPAAELIALPHGSLFWTRRDEVAKRIADHLAGGTFSASG